MQPQPSQPSSSTTRKWLAVGLALVIAYCVFISAARQMLGEPEMTPPSLTSWEVPRPADFRWKLLDLDGNPFDFAKFKGRPILLNLWATYCTPCLAEMPTIARLAASEDLAGRDVAFICVSTDESPEAPRQYLKDKDWKRLTFLRATSLPRAFEADGLPATFLIARDGTIASVEVGAAQWDDVSVVAFLQRLADAKQ